MPTNNSAWITSINILINVLRISSCFDWHVRTFKGGFGNSMRQFIVVYPPNDLKGHELLDQIDTLAIPAFYWKDRMDVRGTINIPYNGDIKDEYDSVMGIPVDSSRIRILENS